MTLADISGHLELDRVTYDALIAHARSDFPYEVCGLLAGEDGELRAHYPIPNAARSMTYYNMEPKALLQAMNDIEDRGWDLLAIYHSHTHTEAYPSPTDVELAFYPEAVYLIVSLQDPDEPVIRAFDIRYREVTERVLTVDGVKAPTGPR
ncbi:MAG TPA: M67 family metallopeptidase [Egibacteraceae bacterium]|jgi:[CysO sulfur-carrier protein]-S-L-cysteine hydrolase|nr:M67 family metallopeptidase [Egibacteraceae bacterium]